MLSPDPGICMIHPSKRPVGVCHLCLRDRLLRLSISGGESSSSQPPSTSSRSSFDSFSCPKHDDLCNSSNNPVGKLGTISSLMESDIDEDAPASIQMPRSKSLSQWNSGFQQPRRSASTKEGIFSRFPRQNGGDPQGAMQCDEEISSKNNPPNGFFPSPLRNQYLEKSSVPGTPLVQISSIDNRAGPSSSSSSRNGHFSWISSLFRKRKKKSVIHSGDVAAATETNFFPPDGWSDVVAPPRHSTSSPPPPPLMAAPPLWRSRSVSSGRILKKSATGSSAAATTTATAAPATVSSLIAVDLKSPSRPTTVAANKVVDNALYDMEEEVAAGYATRGGIPSIMDVDHPPRHRTKASSLARSSSTGKWRKRRIKGESPSSVLANPGAPSDWSFYLTPLRTFRK